MAVLAFHYFSCFSHQFSSRSLVVKQGNFGLATLSATRKRRINPSNQQVKRLLIEISNGNPITIDPFARLRGSGRGRGLIKIETRICDYRNCDIGPLFDK